MVCRSMLASDSGEMDSALFLLSRGVSRGLENRDTAQRGPVKVLEMMRGTISPVDHQQGEFVVGFDHLAPLWDLLLKRWIPDLVPSTAADLMFSSPETLTTCIWRS